MPTILAIGFPGVPEMLIVALVVLLLFGSRLPSVMRSLGVGITEFRKGIKGEIDEEGNPSIEDQDKKNHDDSPSASQTTSTTA